MKLVIDGKECTFLEDTKGEVWKERRHILSPAFSAHKMKLVCKTVEIDYTCGLIITFMLHNSAASYIRI